jgi:hypothetical protein
VSTLGFLFETLPDFMETPKSCNRTKPTVEDCRPVAHPIFDIVEMICIIIFTVDYVLRVATAHVMTPDECGIKCPIGTDGPRNGFCMTYIYFRQWMNLIDLVAVLPFYLEKASLNVRGTAVIRVVRLMRVFRVLRIPRLAACVKMFVNIITEAMPALFILFFMTLLFCILFAACVVFAEAKYEVGATLPTYIRDDPEYDLAESRFGAYIRRTIEGSDYPYERTPFRDGSILYAFWWFFTTASTVGYGDDYPTTATGRIVGITCFYVGIVLVALPITVVGGSFSKHYKEWISEFGPDAKHKKKRASREPSVTDVHVHDHIEGSPRYTNYSDSSPRNSTIPNPPPAAPPPEPVNVPPAMPPDSEALRLTSGSQQAVEDVAPPNVFDDECPVSPNGTAVEEILSPACEPKQLDVPGAIEDYNSPKLVGKSTISPQSKADYQENGAKDMSQIA